jgi:hypothetical protein
MEYNKIISVTGLPGLFELVSSKNDGALVRSLEDKTTKFISNRVHNFSHLESIEVFTHGDNVNLVDVFQSMEKESDKLPEEKDAAGIKAYFQKVFPELDFDRVYNSDMKKMIRWFSILKSNNIEIKLTEVEEEVEEMEEVAPPVEEVKPAQEAKAKAPKPAKAEAKEEKPATKKATPQKKADGEESKPASKKNK